MIQFEEITKSYKTGPVLSNVSFTIDQGNLVAIIGESGCGKTTLLKMVNRLINPTQGKIRIAGKDIQTQDEVTLRRNIGYVIQQTGLFPHMTIRENIELISRLQKHSAEEIAKNTKKLMQMVGLDEQFLERYPTELSGGQQQRVGVARAFATDPDIILMDEPFSALDPMTRADLQDELVHLQEKYKKTIVFVTHDMDEAIKIADKICILREGQILQYDTPENILKNPIDDFVSKFVGKNRIWSSPEYIKISDIMIERPITAFKSLSLLKCIEKMRYNKVDSLLIIEKESQTLLGIVRASQLRDVTDKTQLAEQFMERNISTLHPDQSMLEGLQIVNENQCSTVPVVDKQQRLIGLITRSSLMTTMSQQYLKETEEVLQ